MQVTIDINLLKLLRGLRDSWQQDNSPAVQTCGAELNAALVSVMHLIEPIPYAPSRATRGVLLMLDPQTEGEKLRGRHASSDLVDVRLPDGRQAKVPAAQLGRSLRRAQLGQEEDTLVGTLVEPTEA